MSVEESAQPVTRRSLNQERRRANVFGIIGELFITAGVLVVLFLGWQLWLNDIILGAEQNDAAGELTDEWALPSAPPLLPTTAPDEPVERADPGEPIVVEEPSNRAKFGVLIVPRWGADYERPIEQGVELDYALYRGIGHYPGTQMPGEVGNFAIAAHRTTRGAPFQKVHELRVGDHIYVETKEGWYSYVFRSLEYVRPTGVGVIEPVPQQPGVDAGDRYITLTTCNPMFSAAERLVAYGVYDTWYPREDGPPSEIAETLAARSS